jgi:flotillin
VRQLDGGCIAVPFLHKVSEVNMKTTGLEIERLGPKSMITRDRLRVDAGVEFYIRVQPTEDGVATAGQALGGKSFRASELAETLEGKLVDALLSVAARYTMDDLQDKRGQYAAEVSEVLSPNLAMNGLVLESVSLKRLDQTPFHALDENNAFNALGMRRLAEIITVNKKERAAIEAEAEVAVRQSHLDATKKKLRIEQEEEQAQLEQQREIATTRALSQADIAEQQASAELRREHARISREREVRGSEIERDRECAPSTSIPSSPSRRPMPTMRSSSPPSGSRRPGRWPRPKPPAPRRSSPRKPSTRPAPGRWPSASARSR